jgi:hypothetical protein
MNDSAQFAWFTARRNLQGWANKTFRIEECKAVSWMMISIRGTPAVG